ncbi:hypothetical protein [Mucilaginibacter antarcticus]|uniref:HEAT repeat protein n=1 Tax=Mucilaginibacter antarcticus TaxID=1855725 RepID=A0ABW5XUA9_9SPHI
MDQAQLIKEIDTNIGKIKIVALGNKLHEQGFNLRDLITITLHPEPEVAFRATWLLENIFLQHPETYLPELGYLLSQMLLVIAPGSKRHYAKIVMHLTERNAPQLIKNGIQDIDFEPVIEQLFDWLIDPKNKIAVKAFAAEALFNLRHRYDWITEELANQLQFLMRNGSAAIQSKGKKLLKDLGPL